MASTSQYSPVPPPIPPPPSDLPEGYRAVTGGYRPYTPADYPRARSSHSRTASRDDPQDPSPRRRSGSLTGFFARSKSQTRDPAVAASPTAMSRQQEQLDLAATDAASVKTSNFSRPQQPSSPVPLPLATPIANKQLHSPISPMSPRPDYSASASSSPSVRSPGEYLDPRSRADALSGRNVSDLGNINSPRRVRRRKEPTPFNVLVMGAKGSGKTSLVNFLKNALALPPHKQAQAQSTPRLTTTDGPFTSHYVETEIESERVGVTIWDSLGLEKNVADLQIRKAVGFIHSKFEETHAEESKVMRSQNTRDTHIHCVLLVVDPNSLESSVQPVKSKYHETAFPQAACGPAGLSQAIDMLVMKHMRGRVTVLPVISKADTLTRAHMAQVKASVWNSILAEKVSPLDFLNQDDSDAEDSEDELVATDSLTGQTAEDPSKLEEVYLPFTVLTPDPYGDARVRTFPWGQADPLNPNHCDFGRLRDTVFGEWRDDLRVAAREKGYEQWRTAHLARKEGRAAEASNLGGSSPRTPAAF